jgi:hypothetical protein
MSVLLVPSVEFDVLYYLTVFRENIMIIFIQNLKN